MDYSLLVGVHRTTRSIPSSLNNGPGVFLALPSFSQLQSPGGAADDSRSVDAIDDTSSSVIDFKVNKRSERLSALDLATASRTWPAMALAPRLWSLWWQSLLLDVLWYVSGFAVPLLFVRRSSISHRVSVTVLCVHEQRGQGLVEACDCPWELRRCCPETALYLATRTTRWTERRCGPCAL